jgi:outer membrane immunogenic protein
MRRLLLAATALTVSSSAFAAPPPAPAFNWTGCYLGGNLGPGWGNANFSGSTAIAPTDSHGANAGSGVGVLGGGQIGCNLQVGRSWIVGAEGDFGWSSINGTTPDPFFSGKNENLFSRTDWIASATGRVGYAFNNWMFYGKAGAAWANNQYGFSAPPVTFLGFVFAPGFNETGADTAFGGTAGGGVEWAFAPGWSARVEVDYYGFSPRTLTLIDSTSGASSGPIRVKQDIEAIRFGFNYQFWTGGGWLFGSH